MAKNDWNIKQNTQTKLQMLQDIFDIWLTIWNGSKQQKWIAKEWYILDLFAGRGWYNDNGKEINGAPFVFLEKILSYLFLYQICQIFYKHYRVSINK